MVLLEIPRQGQSKVAPVHAMTTYGGVEIEFHLFLNLKLYEGEWSALHPGFVNPKKRATVPHYREDWVSPGAVVGTYQKRGGDSKHISSVVHSLSSCCFDRTIPIVVWIQEFHKLYRSTMSFTYSYEGLSEVKQETRAVMYV
jgi:hypothetical protein